MSYFLRYCMMYAAMLVASMIDLHGDQDKWWECAGGRNAFIARFNNFQMSSYRCEDYGLHGHEKSLPIVGICAILRDLIDINDYFSEKEKINLRLDDDDRILDLALVPCHHEGWMYAMVTAHGVVRRGGGWSLCRLCQENSDCQGCATEVYAPLLCASIAKQSGLVVGATMSELIFVSRDGEVSHVDLPAQKVGLHLQQVICAPAGDVCWLLWNDASISCYERITGQYYDLNTALPAVSFRQWILSADGRVFVTLFNMHQRGITRDFLGSGAFQYASGIPMPRSSIMMMHTERQALYFPCSLSKNGSVLVYRDGLLQCHEASLDYIHVKVSHLSSAIEVQECSEQCLVIRDKNCIAWYDYTEHKDGYNYPIMKVIVGEYQPAAWAVSSHGKHLVTVSSDGMLSIWSNQFLHLSLRALLLYRYAILSHDFYAITAALRCDKSWADAYNELCMTVGNPL